MPPIVITAAITDGASLLLESGDAPAGGLPPVALPRFPFGEDEDSIEESLVQRLRTALGIEVLAQEFVETVYERGEGDDLVVNNLQLVTEWEGTPPAVATSGSRLVWAPLEALPALDLPYEQRQALLGAFGIDAPEPAEQPQSGERPGRAIVLSGPAGAGKSTVARLIAAALERAALIELDALWDQVVSGAPLPYWAGGGREATRQFALLNARNAAALARNFAAAGFDAIVAGVFEEPRELDVFLAALGGVAAHFVTLLPDEDELLRRDALRPEDERMGERSRELHGIFLRNGELRGMRVDSGGLSAEETAALVLQRLADARV